MDVDPSTDLHSAEAAIALRQRLNETVDQLDNLKKQHAELEVKFDGQVKELTIAKSDRELFLLLYQPRATIDTNAPHS